FDDLEVKGTPVYRDMVPTRSSGTVLLPAGASFNLDSGAFGGVGGDLIWTGSAIQALQGTQLVLLYGGFDAVTYRQLQLIQYPLTAIGAGAIPGPLFPPLVFGARTGEGLYARCAVLQSPAGLQLMWRTYARPPMSLTVETVATV